ncbi:MAG TPA: YsnF/AvaK domain-containing protein [Tepidisphaeraceae bacterium]|jgi:uncharacterized protein (TIGR02271 family)
MAYDSSDKPGSTQPDRNPDPITGAPGSHPLGTGIGTGSGALTGAAMGAIGGPVGAAIGLIAGGIVGAIAGHKAGEYNDPTEDYSQAGQKHADPVARTTNATSTGTTGGSSTGSSMTSKVSDTASAAGDKMKSGLNSAASAVGMKSGSTSRHNSLDVEDVNYFRNSHKSASYAKPDHDFDNDFVPAYGYGTEVSRHAATSGAKFNDLDKDLRSGWDHVRGSSKLSYDQARPAIEEAYNRTLRLHEERLKVGKENVKTGDVSIRKEIVTEQKQIEVPVEREEVVITTRTLTGQSATGGQIDDTQTIRVPVSEERVNVQKEVVATGEVHLDKKKIQDTKTVVDNIRKETVRVDKTGDVRVNEETGTGNR